MSQLPFLSTETLWQILDGKITDEVVNQLLWDCLGYRYDASTKTWDVTNVDETWG